MVERKVHWYSGSAGMIAALFGYGVSHWQVRCGTSRAPIGWTALSCHRLAKPAWLSSLIRNIEPTSMRSSIKARIAVEQSRDAPQLSTDRGAVLVPRALSCTVNNDQVRTTATVSAALYRETATGVPTLTRSNRSRMSSLYMRMQPYEANVPIDSGRFVPWIAYSPPDRVSARGPIGLPGSPPGITSGSFGLSALTSSGGDQAGLTCLPATSDQPCHCLPARPTPTG